MRRKTKQVEHLRRKLGNILGVLRTVRDRGNRLPEKNDTFTSDYAASSINRLDHDLGYFHDWDDPEFNLFT